LDSSWENIPKKIKRSISTALGHILSGLKKLNPKQPEAIKYCQCLKSLMKNPWGHRNFTKLLCGNPSQSEGNLLK